MQFPNQQQFFDLLAKSQRILIALPAKPGADTVGSALALFLFLRKQNKEVDMVCTEKDFGNLSFLPGIENIKSELKPSKSFVITVDTSGTKLDELSYHSQSEKIDIFLKPKQGAYTEKDVSFGSQSAGYDLIICVDTVSLEQLGPVYTNNTELFFNSVKANIDNHINNENYGNINIVDVTAASTSEIFLELLKQYEENLIDQDVATALLAGIIGRTNSFQHSSTTPNSFLRASQLIGYGAKQQEIILHLFKTKKLSNLKLWGRAMARMKNLEMPGVLYTVVTSQDIEKSGLADLSEILNVFQDFINNISDFRLVFFGAETADGIELYLHSNPNIKLVEIVNEFGGQMISSGIGKATLKNISINDLETRLNSTVENLKARLGM